MHLIVGLGNPGIRYRYSRHNLGYLVVESLANKYRVRIKYRKYRSLIGHLHGNNRQTMLCLPLTFMNLSGQAVKEIIADCAVRLEDALVVCDDVNLPLGKLRIRPRGSSGGHRGLSSIIASLGGEEFPRLRIGVGRSADNIVRHVLGRFSAGERNEIQTAIERAVEACDIWLKEGIDSAMNKFNLPN